jgi:2-oxo-4-hydroxy-4-carboxy-5-ureidoimidazoline decarboxylase
VVHRFNELAPAEAERELLACCASPVWAHRVAAGRPYPDRASLLAAAGTAARDLPWREVSTALAAHPRIGEPPSGTGREAGWSRSEQSGVDGADAATRAELAAANRAYEERFGYVFLIFASGRSDVELLAAARQRLSNDERTEQAVVREELARIAALRLERLVT